MQALSVLSVIFLPLTFLSGYAYSQKVSSTRVLTALSGPADTSGERPSSLQSGLSTNQRPFSMNFTIFVIPPLFLDASHSDSLLASPTSWTRPRT